MALFLLQLDANSTTKYDKSTLVVEADDLATARSMADAMHDGPWQAATGTTIAAASDDLTGWVHRVVVSDGTSATPLHDVSITSVATDDIDDVGPDLVDALRGSAIEAAIAEDGGVFTDETTESNEATADDMTLFPATPAAGVDRYNIGMTNQFGRVLFNVTTVGTGTYTVVWEYWDGSAWATLTTTDDTGGFKNAGFHDVTFTAPTDWATSTINSQGPFYYIRAETQTGTTTQVPLAGEAWAGPGLRASFSTPVVTVAAVADDFGDETLTVTATPAGGTGREVTQMISTIVDQGIAAAVLSVSLDAQTAVPNVQATVDRILP